MRFYHILVIIVVFTAVFMAAGYAEQHLCCDERVTRCNVQCYNGDAYLYGDYCYFGNSHSSSCGCSYENREYCPQPGTISGSVCYYGQRDCNHNGCELSTCSIGRYDRCDPDDGCVSYQENCDARDSESGSRFCKSGDVYVQYRDYYWDRYQCSYHTYDKKVESCSHDCENGRCVNRENCDARDGEYGSRFCKSGDVYVQYRDYYWYGYECRYDSRDKKVEDCSYDCENGHCSYQVRVNCDSMDGEYGQRFCKYGDIYVEYRNYYYTDRWECRYTSYEKKVQTCPSGCSNDKCIPVGECSAPYGKRGDKTCSGKKVLECWDGFWVYDKYAQCCTDAECGGGMCVNYTCQLPQPVSQCSNYCMDNKWYHDAVYANGKCNYSIDACDAMNNCIYEEGRKVCYSFSCSNGCIQTGETREFMQLRRNKTLEFNIDVLLTSSSFVLPAKEWLYNGILFGNNKIEVPVNGYVSNVEFTVEKTNSYGNLEIWLDDEMVYSEKPGLGSHVVSVNKTAEKAVIFAGSSAWRIWSPSTYSIDAKLHVTSVVPSSQSFDFYLSQNETQSMEMAMINVPDRITAMVNGHEVEGIMSTGYLNAGKNTVVFEPMEGNIKGVSAITMFFR
ncbi:MAG: hypothetical protein HZB66_02030 [Candidatus Aenigmarchaeota archaeon]|nr:hypothetical protein [Candidatus Aenigmarchaeota archaeon]